MLNKTFSVFIACVLVVSMLVSPNANANPVYRNAQIQHQTGYRYDYANGTADGSASYWVQAWAYAPNAGWAQGHAEIYWSGGSAVVDVYRSSGTGYAEKNANGVSITSFEMTVTAEIQGADPYNGYARGYAEIQW